MAVPTTDVKRIFKSQNESPGKRSKIADYCRSRLEDHKHERCVFLCLKRGRRFYAIDIPIDEESLDLGLDRLRRASGPWWKRWSLYSAVGVQEINMRVIEVERESGPRPELRVCILREGYSKEIAQFEELINLYTDSSESCNCGEDEDDNNKYYYCVNEKFDGWSDTYCKLQRAGEFKREQRDYAWLPAMLDYYWQHGIDKPALDFLNKVGFVHSYRYVARR
ncbi:hypothetical protein QQS21_010308 [Conoideocrella luteorostrata]|uniref:Uncharacterized protein n=1 Tax=Conoideocrella luteorostrata TaxID=1105319 RepID=A0AAJ0FX03_9HYPO|nr:hypothetical protein QQS21_010308 [Conoideocrella luteorostrata]